jgi:hypothetical protein
MLQDMVLDCTDVRHPHPVLRGTAYEPLRGHKGFADMVFLASLQVLRQSTIGSAGMYHIHLHVLVGSTLWRCSRRDANEKRISPSFTQFIVQSLHVHWVLHDLHPP